MNAASLGKTRRRWTDADLAAEAARYSTMKEFKESAGAAYKTAAARKLLPSICGHMDRLRDQYSDADIADRAAAFQSRAAFRSGDNPAYQAARRRGILDTVCAHMQPLVRYWSDPALAAAAAAHASRRAFEKADGSAYQIIIRRGLSEALMSHMTPIGNGLRRDSPAILYYLRVDAPLDTLFKIGVTNEPTVERRFRYADDRAAITVLDTLPFPTGKGALAVEQEILKEHACWRYVGYPVLRDSGNTELFTRDVLNGRLPR